MDVREWLDAKLTGPGHQFDGHATNGSIKAQIDAIDPTITKLVQAARATIERSCMCSSSIGRDWHTTRCPVPMAKNALAELEKP